MKGKRNVYDVKIEEKEVKKMKVGNKILIVKKVITSKKTKGYEKVEKLCPLLGRDMTYHINSNF